MLEEFLLRANKVVEDFCVCLGSTAFGAEAKYLLIPGGKRVRPMFVYALAADLGIPLERFDTVGLALELLHNASLAHDDLPALDNDCERRGRPALHVAFGEGRALLVGDALVAKAFCLARDFSPVAAQQRFVLAEAFVDLCAGQLLENDSSISRDEIHRLKTGALFRAAAHCVGICCNNDEHGFARFGESFGVLFQHVNDFFDVVGTDAERGRKRSSDLENARPTHFAQGNFDLGLKLISEHYDRTSQALAVILPPNSEAGKTFSCLRWLMQLVEEKKKSI